MALCSSLRVVQAGILVPVVVPAPLAELPTNLPLNGHFLAVHELGQYSYCLALILMVALQ